MPTDSAKPRLSSFGIFTLNHGTGELFRRNKRVPLQGQPSRALVLLVEGGGEIVSREVLRAQIWPNTTHGDFEASLNTAIKKIRQALSDSPKEPRFVQTVHRQGYRFIAPVEAVEPSVETEAATMTAVETAVESAAVAPPRRPMPLVWAAAGVVFIASAAAVLYWLLLPGPPPRILKYTQLTHDGMGKLEPFSNDTDGVLMTDGSRVYFSAVSGTQVVISSVPVDGGETTRLSYESATPVVAKDISPDGSRILAADFYRVSPDLPLEILPLPGGRPRILAKVVAHDAAWSPDGQAIAYARGSDILVASGDGSGSRTLVRGDGSAFWPRWSPDGARLRYTVRDADGGTSLWEVGANGRGAHRLFTPSGDLAAECCGTWSPDGKYFVFQASRFGRTSLWAVRDGGLWPRRDNPVEVTQAPLSMSTPVFSRDGRRIFAIGTQRRGELVRYDFETKQFEICLSGLSADHVEFSRDGQWIAYASYPEGVIWRSRSDGTERLQLSDPALTAWFPRWSPDGKRIAFMGTSPGKPVKIYLVSANGGSSEVLVEGTNTEVDPNWSPDGKRIMFASEPKRAGGNGDSQIETIDLASRQISLLPGSERLNAPRWSPDGRYVAATALSQNKWRSPGVVIFDFATHAWTGLEDDPIDNKWWSADGNYFYFDKYVNNDPAIFRLRISDRRIERVAGLKDIRRSPGIMGWWMGLMPDGSPMVLRDTSIQEVYALDWK